MARQRPQKEHKPVRFGQIFLRYRNSMAAIREFSAQLSPLVASLQAGKQEEHRRKTRQLMDDFRRKASPQATQDVDAFMNTLERATQQKKPGKEPGTLQTVEASILISRLLHLVSGTPEPSIHRDLLNNSILACLVGYFEVLVAELAHAFYRIVPASASNGERGITVNELQMFQSIDEAVEFVASKAVDDLLRKDLDDWTQFFATRMTVNLQELVPQWNQWGEMFQRRHLMLHAGGTVNRRYLAKVHWDGIAWPKKQPAIGVQLLVEDGYINLALDLFEIAGILLCQSVWKKLRTEDASLRLSAAPGHGLIDTIYCQLLKRQWYVAEHLSAWGMKDSDATEEQSLICRFNYWLAAKRQGRWNEIAEAVQSFDRSAKHPRFSLASASLRERPEEFFRPDLIAASGLDVDDLREWPIFDEMRADPRFAEALAKIGAQEEQTGGAQTAPPPSEPES